MRCTSRTRHPALRAAIEVVFGLYVLAAALMPLGHHDLVCHVKSTTHCTTCQVGSSGESSAPSAALSAVLLMDAGAAAAESASWFESGAALAECGRAPPSLV